MRSFGGESLRSQKVSLSGKSKQVESREEVLQRTRLEREKRKQNKLEHASAILIQSTWRAHFTRQLAREEIKARWIAQFGYNGEHATIEDIIDTNSFFLPALCFFLQPSDASDVHRLAKACSLAVAPDATRSTPSSTPSLCSPNILNNASTTDDGSNKDDGSQRTIQRAILRARGLASLSLDALAIHRRTFLDDLRAPYKHPDATSLSKYTHDAVPLIESIMSFISVDSWKDLLGLINAKTVAVKNIFDKLVYQATSEGMFERLANIVRLSCEMPLHVVNESSTPAGTVPHYARKSPPTTAETLCTNLIVRYISISTNAVALSCHTNNMGAKSATSHSRKKRCSMAASLFCIPFLVQRCPSLSPVFNRLWKIAVLQLHEMHAHDAVSLLEWLLNQRDTVTDDCGESGATAALSLLCNLAEGAPGALFQEYSTASAALQKELHHGHGDNTDSVQAIQTYHLLGLEFINVASRILSQYSSVVYMNLSHDGINGGAVFGIEHSEQYRDGNTPLNPKTLPLCVHRACKALSDPLLLSEVLKAALPIEFIQSVNECSASTMSSRTHAVHSVCNFIDTLSQLPDQKQKISIALALRCGLVPRLWYYYFKPLLANNSLTPTTLSASHHGIDPGWMHPLCLFAESFSTSIIISGDRGLYQRQETLPLSELYDAAHPSLGVLSLLRAALWLTLWVQPQQQLQVGAPPSQSSIAPSAAMSSSSMQTRNSSEDLELPSRINRSVGSLMAQLHQRNGRRPFAPSEAFYADGLPAERFFAEISSGVLAGRDANDPGSSRAWTLLAHAPFLVPFFERARVFHRLVSAERSLYRSREVSWDSGAFFAGGAPRQFVSVRRGHELEDAYGTLGVAAPENLRGQVRVSFISEHGIDEAGVDGGGLFKEFLEGVVKNGFDPGLGLFKATADNKLYPNPHAACVVPHATMLLEFIGKMVGKALWEGILLELPLATFFLKKFRGMVCDVDDLPSLDLQMARSLFSLKDYRDGDVSDLGLTFSVTDDVLGKTVEIELIPGGKDIPVTSSNTSLFVHRVAEFKLNTQLKEPTAAFLRGLYALIPRQWIEMFNDRELQELIGGAEDGAALNMDDLKAHTHYSAGYSANHPVIESFWEALASLSPSQQANFLRFVTSCPRPPLLGFAYLEPPLTIQMAGGGGDGDGGGRDSSLERLPTAATCMNLLKLPPYRGGAEQIRDKLLYAVESGAGFDLS